LHASADNYYASTTFAYDNSGNLTEKIDGKGQVINYTYDDINRVLTENYTGEAGTEIEYGYDWCSEGVGRLCSATTSDVVSVYDYNALGLIDKETCTINSTDYETEYDYDRQGQLALITTPDNAEIKYRYNTAGLLETIAEKESGWAFRNYSRERKRRQLYRNY
jgi:YD repeat-containing protein